MEQENGPKMEQKMEGEVAEEKVKEEAEYRKRKAAGRVDREMVEKNERKQIDGGCGGEGRV